MNEELIQSLSLNKILVAILEEYGQLSVSTLKFLDAAYEDKELVIDYDDEGHLFKFSLRGKDGTEPVSN
jgi:hypothetical protein